MDWLIRALGVARTIKDSMSESQSYENSNLDIRTPWNITKQEPINIVAIGAIANKGEDALSKPSTDKFPSSDKQDSKVPSEVSRVSGKPDKEQSTEPMRRKYRFPPRKLDRDAVDVVRRLRRHDYDGYLVGGCVRDLYLGLSPKDFDVSTSARPEEIRKVFRNSRIIGRRFRLAHIYFRGGKIIETATFRGNSTNLDPSEAGGADLLITRDNVWGSEQEDALRRDFTINGLMYDTSRGEILDYVDGLRDLDAKQIRTIGDANIRLQEDPVRILRAVRFAAKLGFKLDPQLEKAMRRHGGELERCAQARILEETFKLFRSGSGADCVKIMLQTNVLGTLLPQLSPYFETQASKEEVSTHADEVSAYLHALDALVRKRGQVSDAVILTAVLFVPLQEALAELEPRLHGTQLNSIIMDLTRNMVLTRRMRERARQILLAQKHLKKPVQGKRPRRRISPKAMIKRSYFADALDLFEIWSRKNEQEFDQVQIWRARAGEWDGEDTEQRLKDNFSDSPAPRRKRRRRKRNNNRKVTSSPSTEKGKSD